MDKAQRSHVESVSKAQAEAAGSLLEKRLAELQKALEGTVHSSAQATAEAEAGHLREVALRLEAQQTLIGEKHKELEAAVKGVSKSTSEAVTRTYQESASSMVASLEKRLAQLETGLQGVLRDTVSVSMQEVSRAEAERIELLRGELQQQVQEQKRQVVEVDKAQRSHVESVSKAQAEVMRFHFDDLKSSVMDRIESADQAERSRFDAIVRLFGESSGAVQNGFSGLERKLLGLKDVVRDTFASESHVKPEVVLLMKQEVLQILESHSREFEALKSLTRAVPETPTKGFSEREASDVRRRLRELSDASSAEPQWVQKLAIAMQEYKERLDRQHLTLDHVKVEMMAACSAAGEKISKEVLAALAQCEARLNSSVVSSSEAGVNRLSAARDGISKEVQQAWAAFAATTLSQLKASILEEAKSVSEGLHGCVRTATAELMAKLEQRDGTGLEGVQAALKRMAKQESENTSLVLTRLATQEEKLRTGLAGAVKELTLALRSTGEEFSDRAVDRLLASLGQVSAQVAAVDGKGLAKMLESLQTGLAEQGVVLANAFPDLLSRLTTLVSTADLERLRTELMARPGLVTPARRGDRGSCWWWLPLAALFLLVGVRFWPLCVCVMVCVLW